VKQAKAVLFLHASSHAQLTAVRVKQRSGLVAAAKSGSHVPFSVMHITFRDMGCFKPVKPKRNAPKAT
jgi:hypothetical protein